MILRVLRSLPVAAMLCGCASAAPLTDLGGGQSGEISFLSYDLPGGAAANATAIETGSYKRNPTAIRGFLYLPEGITAPVPAVVIVHGSAGVWPHHHKYARLLNEIGIAGFVIDSFAPRGIVSTVEDQSLLPVSTTVIDAFQALKLLASHPLIDGARIAVMGFSRGGMVADFASREWFRRHLAPDGVRFAAHVAYYDWCGAQENDVKLTGAPLLFLHGAADDWTPLALCENYVARVRAAGFPAELIAYPGAYHAFDWENLPVFRRRDAERYDECGYRYDDGGVVSMASGRRYGWSQLDSFFAGCMKHGAHLGSNPKARARALEDMKRFFTRTLLQATPVASHTPSSPRAVKGAPHGHSN